MAANEREKQGAGDAGALAGNGTLEGQPSDDSFHGEAVVAFRVESVWLGIEARAVASIADWTELTWLPRAPDHVLGLLNESGYPVPVIDLGAFFGMEPASADRDAFFQRIVVASAGDMRVGFRCDQVMGVLEKDTIVASAVALNQNPRLAQLALAELEGPGAVVTLLDVNALLERARVAR